jgi:hypothetical protein
MEHIAVLLLLSNRMPEKCDFEEIKRANPLGQIHPLEL